MPFCHAAEPPELPEPPEPLGPAPELPELSLLPPSRRSSGAQSGSTASVKELEAIIGKRKDEAAVLLGNALEKGQKQAQQLEQLARTGLSSAMGSARDLLSRFQQQPPSG